MTGPNVGKSHSTNGRRSRADLRDSLGIVTRPMNYLAALLISIIAAMIEGAFAGRDP